MTNLILKIINNFSERWAELYFLCVQVPWESLFCFFSEDLGEIFFLFPLVIFLFCWIGTWEKDTEGADFLRDLVRHQDPGLMLWGEVSFFYWGIGPWESPAELGVKAGDAKERALVRTGDRVGWWSWGLQKVLAAVGEHRWTWDNTPGYPESDQGPFVDGSASALEGGAPNMHHFGTKINVTSIASTGWWNPAHSSFF